MKLFFLIESDFLVLYPEKSKQVEGFQENLHTISFKILQYAKKEKSDAFINEILKSNDPIRNTGMYDSF